MTLESKSTTPKPKKQQSKQVPYRLLIDADGENSQNAKILKAQKDLGFTRPSDVFRVALAFYFQKNGY